MSDTNGMTAAEKYRSHLIDKPEVIVEVIPPSGFVFKFAKPSTFTMLFRYGRMPQVAANGAVAAWVEAGLLKPGEISEDKAKQIDEGIKLRDRVLELSREPKLVIGEALNENELSTDDLSDDDAQYLFAWVTAGGEVSAMLGNFPQRSGSGALVSNGGPKRRKARK